LKEIYLLEDKKVIPSGSHKNLAAFFNENDAD
jgi:hypothetical protein